MIHPLVHYVEQLHPRGPGGRWINKPKKLPKTSSHRAAMIADKLIAGRPVSATEVNALRAEIRGMPTGGGVGEIADKFAKLRKDLGLPPSPVQRRLEKAAKGAKKPVHRPPAADWAKVDIAKLDKPADMAKVLGARHPDWKVSFHRDTDPEVARQFVAALEDVTARYPQIQLVGAGIRKFNLDAYAQCKANPLMPGMAGKAIVEFNMIGPTRILQPSIMDSKIPTTVKDDLGEWTFADKRWLDAHYAHNHETGFHHRADRDEAVRAITTHEMGHALDAAGLQVARRTVTSTVKRVYKEQTGKEFGDTESFNWLHANTSKGSWSKYTLSPSEVLAESFTDVELNGDEASPVSHALYDLLVRSANNVATVRSEPGAKLQAETTPEARRPALPAPKPDTPQQKAVLRTHKPSQKARKMFPYGTRVEGAPGRFGTVVRHVPSTSALGGHLVVVWDNGSTGNHPALGQGITRVGPETTPERAAPAIRQTAYDIALAKGGVTISLAGNQPTKGFVYAPDKATEFRIPKADITPEDVDRYIDEHFDELTKPGNHLGMWTEGDDMVLDVSRVGPTNAKTIAAAQAADQLGVFDLESFTTIDVGTIDAKGRYTKRGEAAGLLAQHRRQVQGPDQSGGPGGPGQVPRGHGYVVPAADLLDDHGHDPDDDDPELKRFQAELRREFADATPDIVEGGAKWYEQRRAWITMLNEKYPEIDDATIAAIAAAFSPQTDWDANVIYAMNFVRMIHEQRSDEEILAAFGKKGSAGNPIGSGAVGANVQRALRVTRVAQAGGDPIHALRNPEGKDHLDNPKVWDFARNLLGDHDALTADRWAATGVLADKSHDAAERYLKPPTEDATGRDIAAIANLKGKAAELKLRHYYRVAKAYRTVAAENHLNPEQFQAIIWGVVRPGGFTPKPRTRPIMIGNQVAEGWEDYGKL